MGPMVNLSHFISHGEHHQEDAQLHKHLHVSKRADGYHATLQDKSVNSYFQ